MALWGIVMCSIGGIGGGEDEDLGVMEGVAEALPASLMVLVLGCCSRRARRRCQDINPL